MNPKNPHDHDGALLNDKLLASIIQHLNQDHFEDLLACAKASEPLEWAEQAKVTHLDTSGITIEVSNNLNAQSVRLEFPTTARGVLSLRRLLGAMIAESRAKLGWPVAIDSDESP